MTCDLLMHFPLFLLTCTLSAYIKETLHMCKSYDILSYTLKLGHCQALDNLVLDIPMQYHLKPKDFILNFSLFIYLQQNQNINHTTKKRGLQTKVTLLE